MVGLSGQILWMIGSSDSGAVFRDLVIEVVIVAFFEMNLQEIIDFHWWDGTADTMG